MARLGASFLTFFLLFAVTAAPVQAQAPSNDDIGSPTTIAAIPFSDGPYSTDEATTGPTDPPFCFGGEPDSQTVWYQYTAEADGPLLADTAGSDYDTTLYVGTPDGSGGIDVIACTDDVASLQAAVVFDAAAGTTYLFMVGSCCAGGGAGGNLVFSLQEGPPLLTVDLSLSSTVLVTKAGVATVTGTATCSGPVFASVDIELRQAVGRFIISGFGFAELIDCGPDGTPFAVEIVGDNGRFGPGKGSVGAFLVACDEFQCAESSVEQDVRLRRAR